MCCVDGSVQIRLIVVMYNLSDEFCLAVITAAEDQKTPACLIDLLF